MASSISYDPTDKHSIEAYAKRLELKSLRMVANSVKKPTYLGKGKLGQLVEDLYFQYKPNSESKPDFPDAGVELKTSPLKSIRRNGKPRLVSKERLVLNIINYAKEASTSFETSSFWRKNRTLLILFYLHQEGAIDIDLVFKICRLWDYPVEDLKIIRDDWEKILSKIRAGKAHELSEGDTI